MNLSEKLLLEKKSLGYYLSGHPVSAIETKIKKVRSALIKDITNDTKKLSTVSLINNIRQIKDRKGNPLTFINFDDGTGIMDGIISSDVHEKCHSILKEGKIIIIKGLVEIDDYRSKEVGNAMYRMRVKDIEELDDALKKNIKKIVIEMKNSNVLTLNEMSEKIDQIEKDFWIDGNCKINIKVNANNSEALIELGQSYLFKPTLANLNFLEDIFGKESIEVGI